MTEHWYVPRRFESAPAPAAEIYSRIGASIAATPPSKWHTRTRVIAASILVPCLTAAAVISASQLLFQRQAVGLYFEVVSRSQLLLVLFLLALLTLVATFVAMRRGPYAMGSGLAVQAITAGLVTPIYAVLVLAWPVHYTGLIALSGVVLSSWGYRCLTLAVVVGALVLASFTVALRRAVPTANWLRGAVLGTAAGAWAGLGLFIFCPSGQGQHVLVGHVLPILAFTVIGAIAAPRALRP